MTPEYSFEKQIVEQPYEELLNITISGDEFRLPREANSNGKDSNRTIAERDGFKNSKEMFT